MYRLYTISKGINACFKCHPCFEACRLYGRLFCAGRNNGVHSGHCLQEVLDNLSSVSVSSPRCADMMLHTLGPVLSPICLISSSCLSVAFCASSSAFLFPLVCCSLSAYGHGAMPLLSRLPLGRNMPSARSFTTNLCLELLELGLLL